MEENLTREEVISVIEEYGASVDKMLAILLELQRRSKRSYIDEDTAGIVADAIGISRNRMFEILTFYTMLETKPNGRYIIEVCNCAPCYFNKSDSVIKVIENVLGIKPGEVTYDGKFALKLTGCLGACDIGPVIKIGFDVYGNLTPERIKEIIEMYRKE